MARLKTLRPRLAEQAGRVAVAQAGSWRTANQSSTQRGYGYRWQQAREQFLRDNPLCVYCQREGKVTAATIVDHIIQHCGDQDLFWDQTNWQGLCVPHHSSDKQREENAARRG
ncbi:HNH endonuclease [Pseudomonas tohonis]|uniref:HNH endonuclease n=1 Tax=Pseudomonas tohonis TaxID=2725477 RepID=UPI001F22C118|nr:HNH endonuclease signature motif containing protein [Pseudomonas tohonis]